MRSHLTIDLECTRRECIFLTTNLKLFVYVARIGLFVITFAYMLYAVACVDLWSVILSVLVEVI